MQRLPQSIAAAVVALGLYSTLVEPYWIEVTRHEVQGPIVPALKIAHISDLHTSGFGRRERHLLALLEQERPDLIVVTGDTVVDGELGGKPPVPDDLSYERASETLRRLHAPLGVYAVKGNWEGIRRVSNERSYYERNGVRLLSNDVAPLRPRVWLAGFDDIRTNPSLDALLRIPAGSYVIALFHSPAFFDRLEGRVDLALAGHTHGGQVRPPFVPPFWLPYGCGRYLEGWYVSGGSRLYVSRGIGTSGLPIRFLCRPELSFVTIGGGSGAGGP